MYGPQRPMLPPSPQHFPPPRFTQPPLPAPSPSLQNNGAPPPHKRPGSSMSISSMLGTAEPEKSAQEQYHNHSQHVRTNSRPPSLSGPAMPLGAVMSPPQYPTKPHAAGEYSYKPRSKTPDRVTAPSLGGARPHRSSSGTMTQRPGPFYEPPRSTPTQQPASRY